MRRPLSWCLIYKDEVLEKIHMLLQKNERPMKNGLLRSITTLSVSFPNKGKNRVTSPYSLIQLSWHKFNVLLPLDFPFWVSKISLKDTIVSSWQFHYCCNNWAPSPGNVVVSDSSMDKSLQGSRKWKTSSIWRHSVIFWPLENFHILRMVLSRRHLLPPLSISPLHLICICIYWPAILIF